MLPLALMGRRRRCGNAAILPIIAGLTLYGGSGGMAPHAVHVRANVLTGEGSSTGDDGGWWPEGRWQFHFRKADGTEVDVADRNWMKVTDPIDSTLVNTYTRYGCAPNAAFVFRSAGSYQVRVRYQNRHKVWSEWAVSDTITVAANTRTKRYVNLSTGNDANDGTSTGQAKLTMRGALLLVNGNDFEIEVARDSVGTSGAQVDLSAYTGVWIHPSTAGTAKPLIDVEENDNHVLLGSHSIIEGLEYAELPASIPDVIPAVSLLGHKANAVNVTFADIDFNRCGSFLSNGNVSQGCLVLRCVQKQVVEAYAYFGTTESECLNILGCDFTGGSTGEHTVRLQHPVCASVDYSILDYSGNANHKSCFRAFGHHIGLFRTEAKNGKFEFGNIDGLDPAYPTFADYCVDQCRLIFDVAANDIIGVGCFEDTSRIVYRSSIIKKATSGANDGIAFQDRGGATGGTATVNGIRILNCSIWRTGRANSPILNWTGLTVPPTDVLVRGCLFHHDPADFVSDNVARHYFVSGVTYEDCVHGPSTFGYEFGVDGVPYETVAAANAESWADGLIEEDHDFNETTGEPGGAGANYLTAVSSSRGVFDSINGVDCSTPGPAGCWRPA